jgi:hypothetical protein
MKTIFLPALMAGLFLTGNIAAAEEPLPAGGPPAASASSPSHDQPRHADSDRDGLRWQKNLAGLSDGQKAKVKELRERFDGKVRIEFQELSRLNHDLVNESIKQSPNTKKVAELSRKIGNVHEKLATLRSNQLHELSTMLSREQVQKFNYMKETSRHQHL